MTDQRWTLLPARGDEPGIFRVVDSLGTLPEQIFPSLETARAWLAARGAPPLKQSTVFTFEHGTLALKRSGYGYANGLACFSFPMADLEAVAGDDGPVAVIKLGYGEAEELRDWLNRELPLVQPA